MYNTRVMYKLQNLSKRYQHREVLNIKALNIYKAEILAIVGPSGAGKSTFLRLLNFLEPPTTGQIIFNGEVIQAKSVALSLRRQVTTVFQQSILLKRSVADNVAFGLQIRGKKEIKSQVVNLLKQVRLANMADVSANLLSGGEAQRVALARALAIKPTVLLLDEPTANLDPGNVKLIEQIIRDVNEAEGVTVVLVTHNLFQARRLAHRTALMLNGQIIEVAPTEAIFNTPSDERTRAFIKGEMVY